MELSPQVPALLMFRPDEERCCSPAHLTTPWGTPAATVPYTGYVPTKNKYIFIYIYIKNSQCSDRTNQKYIFRGRLVWTHIQSLQEWTLLYHWPNLQKQAVSLMLPYYRSLASNSDIKAPCKDQSHCRVFTTSWIRTTWSYFSCYW